MGGWVGGEWGGGGEWGDVLVGALSTIKPIQISTQGS